MRELTLTDAQFEHTLGIIGEIDLTPLLAAFGQEGKMVDLLAALPVLSQVREKHIFRRLEAIWSANPDTLEQAEANVETMKTLEAQAAKKPIKDTLDGLVAFIAGLGLSLTATPGSSALDLMKKLDELTAADPSQPAEPSPSGDS